MAFGQISLGFSRKSENCNNGCPTWSDYINIGKSQNLVKVIDYLRDLQLGQKKTKVLRNPHDLTDYLPKFCLKILEDICLPDHSTRTGLMLSHDFTAFTPLLHLHLIESPAFDWAKDKNIFVKRESSLRRWKSFSFSVAVLNVPTINIEISKQIFK